MHRVRPDVAVSALAILLLVTVAGGPAAAAVLICKEMITTDEEKARTQVEARRLALQRWTVLAGLHGERFTAWRLAGNKLISCRLLADGLYHCQARGSPCTISQVMPPVSPPAPPPGAAPSKPDLPQKHPATRDELRI